MSDFRSWLDDQFGHKKPDLRYHIADQLMEGSLGGVKFRFLAGSGGRAGSKKDKVVLSNVANNPFMTDLKYVKNHPILKYGGPLHIGKYRMEIDKKRESKNKKWITLIPDSSNRMFDRGGFAIHASGDIGSQGCIVPYVYSELVKLWNVVKSNNGGTLEVLYGDISSVRV